MFLRFPPMKVSSTSTRLSMLNVPCFHASLSRWAMNQALFWVILRSRCNFIDDTPLRDVDHRNTATTHFLKGILDRCMTVLVLTLKCLRQEPHQQGSGLREGTALILPSEPHIGRQGGSALRWNIARPDIRQSLRVKPRLLTGSGTSLKTGRTPSRMPSMDR